MLDGIIGALLLRWGVMKGAVIESLLIVLIKRHLQCFHIQRCRRDCVVTHLGDDTLGRDARPEACIQIVGAGAWNYFIALGHHK